MKNYYPTKKSKCIINLDSNNWYGWKMIQYLPYGEFKWVKNVDNFDNVDNSISKNSSYGYILGVDIEYPDELHNLQNNYLLAPEKPEITYDMSDYCKKGMLTNTT